MLGPHRTPQSLPDLAREIGQHLRAGRKTRFPADTQEDFARRIGVSHYTCRKMEKGDPSVAMGSYLRAAILLGLGEQLAAAFRPAPPSLFERRHDTRRDRS